MANFGFPPLPPLPAPLAPLLTGGEAARKHDALNVGWPEPQGVTYDLSITGPAGARTIAAARPSVFDGLEEAATYEFRLRVARDGRTSDWSAPLRTCTRPKLPAITFGVRWVALSASVSWQCAGPGRDDLGLTVELSTVINGDPTVWENALLTTSVALAATAGRWTIRARFEQPHELAPGGINVSVWTAPETFVVDATAFLMLSPLVGHAASLDAMTRILGGRHGA